MNNLMPFVALMSLPKDRRRHLLPLAMSAAAGMPAAQSGALAVISADSAARREGKAADAAATDAAVTAVTEVITAAVAKGAALTAEDLQHIPLAQKALAAKPDILSPGTVQAQSATGGASGTVQAAGAGPGAAKKAVPAKRSSPARKTAVPKP